MQIRFLTAAALVVAFFVADPRPAAAVQCGDHQALAKHLGAKFSERLSATGKDERGRRIELYRSSSGSWTLVLILDEGPACILTAGSKWKGLVDRVTGRDA